MWNLQVTGWLLLATHLLATVGWAGAGARVTLPLPGVVAKRTSGFRMDLYSHWVESPGYRPLIVTVSSFAPATTFALSL